MQILILIGWIVRHAGEPGLQSDCLAQKYCPLAWYGSYTGQVYQITSPVALKELSHVTYHSGLNLLFYRLLFYILLKPGFKLFTLELLIRFLELVLLLVQSADEGCILSKTSTAHRGAFLASHLL